jgi:Phage integrase family
MNKDPLAPLRKEVREIQDRHPELSPDNAFVVWFLRAFIVDEESTARSAIVGGARDKGVDGLHIDHDNRLVSVIQGKYRQNANAGSENRSDVLALANLGRVLAKKETQEFKALLGDADAAVEGLLGKARDAIQKRGYRLVLNFVTTGKVSSTHREEAVQCLDDWDFVSFEVHARNDLIRRMQDYVALFPEAGPDSFLFPFHKAGLAGNKRIPTMWGVDLARPIGSWRKAWLDALREAKVRYRWHDLRHTFISRLAENPGVSEQTIRALAGHVSRQMLERYSHIRSEAKYAAIQALEKRAKESESEATGHKTGHSAEREADGAVANPLEAIGGPTRIRTWDQRIMSPLL